MKELILHAGVHKTGSTTIQKALAAAPEFLADRGLYYPAMRCGEEDFFNHSVALFTLFSKAPETHPTNVRLGVDINKAKKDYVRQLEDQLAVRPNRDVVLSGEEMSSLRADELTAMRAFLEGFGRTLRVVVYVRRPFSHLTSVWSEKARGGATLADLPYPRSGPERLQDLEAAFGEIEVVSYEAAAANERGLFADFWTRLGRDADDMPAAPLENRSGGDHAVRLISGINAQQPVFLTGADGARSANPARRPWDTDLFLDLPGPRFTPTEAEAGRFLKRLEVDNAWFRERYGEAFCDPEIAFSDPEPWGEAQLAALRDILASAPEHLRLLAYGVISRLEELDAGLLRGVFFTREDRGLNRASR
ncbi:MAG: hypothetical protein AAFR11_06495 [Pseudomonadota bacterium]